MIGKKRATQSAHTALPALWTNYAKCFESDKVPPGR
jgi:hypothetical protein